MNTPCFLVLSVLLTTSADVLSAQTRTVVGRVTSAVSGQPVSSGVISVDQNGPHDTLRPDGVFILHLGPNEYTASVRATGYRPRELTITRDQTTLFIELQPNAIGLPGLTYGGGTTLRNAPTSTATLPLDEGASGGQTHVLDGLQGKLPGVDVHSNSGVPGGDFQLTLRGVTTILASSSPLYIVDGVYVSNASVATGLNSVTGGQEAVPSRIADLNQDDIASIEVLRGAAAASRYGSRGSNGVVIITTKRGRR